MTPSGVVLWGSQALTPQSSAARCRATFEDWLAAGCAALNPSGRPASGAAEAGPRTLWQPQRSGRACWQPASGPPPSTCCQPCSTCP
eukprot:13088608-Heterocapsa_arctica.AAC.1